MARGVTARFDGDRLQVDEGRTTWIIPVRAVRAAELTADGYVRVVISGTADDSTHGLGADVELPAPNSRAAAAFLEHLGAALEAVTPVADGHALVVVKTTERKRLGTRRRVVETGGAVVAYLLVLGLLASTSPLGPSVASFTLGRILGPLSCFLVWRMARRLRSLRILRERGVGVVATVTGERHIATRGAMFVFPELAFGTVEGRRMRDVVSVVSCFLLRVDRGASVDVVYDPENPALASRPATAPFLLRTALSLAIGTLGVPVFVVILLVNLPR